MKKASELINLCMFQISTLCQSVRLIARIVIPLRSVFLGTTLSKINIFSKCKTLHDPWYLFFISVNYSRCYCTWINCYTDQMSVEEIIALMTLFFFSTAFHPHTVTYQQHADTKNTSHRSSSILNSVKWITIDEVR